MTDGHRSESITDSIAAEVYYSFIDHLVRDDGNWAAAQQSKSGSWGGSDEAAVKGAP